MKFLYFLFVALFSFSVQSQTISGIVTDEKKSPIADVSVFFDNSTTETVTKSDGSFSIPIPENNRNLLVFSGFGYKYYVVENPKPQDNLQVRLQLEDNELEELVINRAEFSRKEFLRAFRYFFIGNTKNAKRTKILNEEVLSFYFDKNSNTFYAYADQPIKVENKKLAYDILFHLDTFEVQYNRTSLDPNIYFSSHFLGYMQYRDIADGNKKSLKNRQETYNSSSMAFFTELANNEIGTGNFILAVNGLAVDSDEYFDVKKGEDYLLNLKKIPTRKKPVYTEKAVVNGVFNPNLVTEYEEIEVPFVVLNKDTQEQSQLYFQQQKINIDAKGNLQNPKAVFFSGYFGELKVADMLPLDYEPIKSPKKNDLEKKSKMPTYSDFEKEAIDFYSSKEYMSHVKARKHFFDKLKVEYNYKVHEPFILWIDENLSNTSFVSTEEGINLHKNFVSTYKAIKNKQEDIEKKEDYFMQVYGEKKFNEMYSKAIIEGVLNKAEFDQTKIEQSLSH